MFSGLGLKGCLFPPQMKCSEPCNPDSFSFLDVLNPTLRVQVPNNHILSKTVTYKTTIINPSTRLLGPLDP